MHVPLGLEACKLSQVTYINSKLSALIHKDQNNLANNGIGRFEPAAGSARAPTIHWLEVFAESPKGAIAGHAPLTETVAAAAAVRPSASEPKTKTTKLM